MITKNLLILMMMMMMMMMMLMMMMMMMMMKTLHALPHQYYLTSRVCVT